MNKRILAIAISMAIGSLYHSSRAATTSQIKAGAGETVTVTDDVEYSGFNSSALYAHDGGKITSDGFDIQGGRAGKTVLLQAELLNYQIV